MKDYTSLLAKWEQILGKISNNNGLVHPLVIGEKVTIHEIEAKEQEVGYILPPSYKSIIQNIGNSLSLYYSFSEGTMIPPEFHEITSGELHWDLDSLQNLNILADELMEDGVDYGANLRGKLEFSHAGNGDIYAFDMSVENEEKPVVYWDHEEDTVTYIADSFIDYLHRITELKCVGSEKWQLDYFLGESGLDPSSPTATEWKQWFETFSEITLYEVENDIESLVGFVVHRGKLNRDSIDSFRKFDSKNLFDTLLKELNSKADYQDQQIICEIMGNVLADIAESWVRSLWGAKQDSLDTRLRSYLTAMCIEKNTGLPLVVHFLEQEYRSKIPGYEALSHLAGFNSNDVISWMEKTVSFPVTEGWDELFMSSSPTWENIKKWTALDEKHEVTVIHALENFVHCNEEHNYAISDLPPVADFHHFLVNLRDRQVLKRRVSAIDNIILEIDRFYN